MRGHREGLWRGLCLFVLLHTVGAWAEDDAEPSECDVSRPEDGGTAELLPSGELTRHACSTKWCVGTNYYYMGFSHSLTCLYVTDKAGVPTGTTSLGNDLVGLKVVRFVSDNVVELSYSTNRGSSSERYDISEQGRVTRQRSPHPSEEQRLKWELARKTQQEAEEARRKEVEAHSSCDGLRSEPECHGQEPPDAVKASIAKVCHVPADSVKGVCSKTGCMGFAPLEGASSSHPEYCVVWAPRGKPPIALPYSWGELGKLVLDGSKVCLYMSMECSVIDVWATEECADVSGPVARWVRGPAEGAAGNGNYDVLPYKGAAPVIDGNAQEPQWKAPTLWLHTAALVKEGLEAWGGTKDASAEWIFRSRGEELLFLLRVNDDQVIASETPARNDAVSLSFSANEAKASEVRFVLAPKGKVSTPGAAHARCAWSKIPDGYRMECALPLKELGLARPPLRWDGYETVEDRDGPGKPLKRLGSSNRLIAWSEFPPRWDEASQLQSWDPCMTSGN